MQDSDGERLREMVCQAACQQQPRPGGHCRAGHGCACLLLRSSCRGLSKALLLCMQAEIARVKAEAAAEVSAATARAAAAAASAAVDAAAGDGSTADAAGQKAQLERAVAELNATLAARQKDFDARLRLVAAGLMRQSRGSDFAAGWSMAASGVPLASCTPCMCVLVSPACRGIHTVRDAPALSAVLCCAGSDMERRHLQEKEKMRKEAAAKIRETKTAMTQLAGEQGWQSWRSIPMLLAWCTPETPGSSSTLQLHAADSKHQGLR